MPKEQDPINKIFLLLQTNGYIVLDKDHLWDGCDTPELDPSIEMSPVSIRKLCELVCSRNLEWPETKDADRLNILLDELKASAVIVEDTIQKINAKT